MQKRLWMEYSGSTSCRGSRDTGLHQREGESLLPHRLPPCFDPEAALTPWPSYALFSSLGSQSHASYSGPRDVGSQHPTYQNGAFASGVTPAWSQRAGGDTPTGFPWSCNPPAPGFPVPMYPLYKLTLLQQTHVFVSDGGRLGKHRETAFCWMWVDWELTREMAVMMEERERPPQTRKGPTLGDQQED